MRFLGIVAISALVACLPKAEAQAPTGSIVRFDMENATLYVYDCRFPDVGSNPNNLGRPLTTLGIFSGLGIADIVSVNGNPAKGTAYEEFHAAFLSSPNPGPGRPITDGVRASIAPWDLDFLNTDGTQIGTIHIDGFVGGMGPPGAPKEIPAGGYTVTGGSGAFLGVRGYFQTTPNITPERVTSACEDPSLRRVFAGTLGKRRGFLYLLPMSQPQILITPNGPAVVHPHDFTRVTAPKPAKAGDLLSLFAPGLGPTRPGVEPVQPFTADPPQVVNSPVQVFVNENPADVLYAGGSPSAVGVYQKNILPPEIARPGPHLIPTMSAPEP